MRFILIFAVVCSCSPFQKSKRLYSRLQNQIKLHPELVDSFKIVQRDTIRLDGFTDTVKIDRPIDSTLISKIDSLTRELAAHPEKAPTIIRRIIHAAAISFSHDSTYYVTLSNDKEKIRVPVKVSIQADATRISIAIEAGSGSLPEATVITKVEFKELPHSPWRNIYFYLFIGVLLALILALLRR